MKHSWKKATLGVAIVGVLVGGLAQPAAAAYSTYYNGSTVKLSQKNSQASTGISGGRGSLDIMTADFYINLLTWSGVGAGYTRYGGASGNAPGYIYMDHAKVAGSATGSCFWSVGADINGSLNLTCAVNR